MPIDVKDGYTWNIVGGRGITDVDATQLSIGAFQENSADLLFVKNLKDQSGGNSTIQRKYAIRSRGHPDQSLEICRGGFFEFLTDWDPLMKFHGNNGGYIDINKPINFLNKINGTFDINGDLKVSNNSNVKNIIASGYINTTALTSSDYIRSVNFIASGFIQVRPTNGFGQVISGIGIRSSGRSQQFLLSNGDGVSETYYGSDSDGTGTADKNHKWCFSSRSSTDNKFIFYRAPFYTKNSFDNVMDFQNVDEKNCVINLNKPTNISGETKISNNLNVTQKIITSSIQIGGNDLPIKTHYVAQLNWDWIVAQPTFQMQLIGNTVTMTIGSIPRTPTVGSVGRSSINTP